MSTSRRLPALAIVLLPGIAVALLIYGARQAVPPSSPWLLVIIGVAFLVAPISRSYSRRLLLGGTLLLGWLPVLWWIPLPVPFDRVGIAVAVTAGVIASLAARQWRAGATILPRPRLTDAIPVAAAVMTTWLYLPFLSFRSELGALNLLIKSGWDHVAHLYMVKLIAENGSVLATLGSAPDGSLWPGATYPKHFHVLVDAMIDLVGSPSGAVTASSYTTGVALVMLVTMVTIAAGVAQLPWLHNRTWLAAPLAILALSGYLFGPGVQAFAAGYPNFIFGCAAASLCIFIVAGMSRASTPLYAFALAGLLAATAHSWLLLLPLAGASAVAILFPFRIRWRGSRRQVVLTVLAVACALIGVLSAVVIAGPDLRSSTVLIGQAQAFPDIPLIASFVICAVVAAIELWRRPRPVSSGGRTVALAAVPAVGFLVLAAIGIQQLVQSGEVLYYFTKLATGTLLVVTTAAVVMIASTTRRLPRPRTVRGAVGLLAVGAIAAAFALQTYGYVGPRQWSAGFPASSGTDYRAAAQGVSAVESSEEAANILHAAAIAAERPFGATLYYATKPNDPIPHLATQWHQVLAGRWSVKTEGINALVDQVDREDTPGDIKRILHANSEIDVIVPPDVKIEVDKVLPSSLSRRVLSW